jgi:hypothetical protein
MSAEGPEPPGTTAETPSPDQAAETLSDPAGPPGPPRGPDPADSVAVGMGYLDQAIEAFSRACESADGDIMPFAIELLARTLPLRGRDADAALVWQRGLEDPDPAVETAVRTRLRRAFGGDEVPAEGEDADPTWWEGFVEAAVCYGTLPLLANEIFGALDQMYSLAALPLAQGGGRARDLREILLSAVRVPSQYAWGEGLHESFRVRLRDAMGASSDVLPPNWPD